MATERQPPRRTGPRLFRAALVLAAAGVVLGLAGHGTTATAAAVALLGVAGVLLVSLAFHIVGESEDRARERRPGG